MRIKNRKSYVTKSVESFAPEKIVYKIAHWGYLLLLFSMFAYFIYYLYLGFVTYDGFGHVKVKKTSLSAVFDGKIKALPLSEGQDFDKNALIAKLSPAIRCKVEPVAIAEIPKEDKRIAQLAYDIRVNQIRARQLKQSLAALPDQQEQQMLRRALELSYDDSKRQITAAKLDSEAFFLREKLAVQRKMLAALQQQTQAAIQAIIPSAPIASTCLDEIVAAPFKGVVRRLLLQKSEFAKRGAPIAIVERENAEVRIEAFLDKSDLQYLAIGQTVSITFPDGIESMGLVQNIHSSAYAFPELEWKHYEPLDTSIRLHITPVDKTAAVLWRNYDLLRVRIRGDHQ
ncbi:MAG: HlyD family efflux transporter periplasmic adaptor subunit [Methyloprofundus sp.]|nr:HlyD family efflux transporter periplasmic adaptor subunit [Methyloprofundus sp.]